MSRVTRWLRFLGWLDEPEEDRHPYSVELGAFEEWMRAERGHAERTIGTSLRSTGEFLDWLTGSGKRLESVRIADVDAAIEAKTARRHYSRVTIRGYAERLRAFFRFAEDRGWCTPGMAEGIVPPRFYPDEKVRSTLSRDDGRCLLATTDGIESAFKGSNPEVHLGNAGEDGYVAISSVPHAATGFLYMAVSVAALHWNSWSFLNRLLSDKFEWYYMSGRPLFSFVFYMEYFFHVEAFGRRASSVHDFNLQVLSQPEYLRTLGLKWDSLLTVYVQTQMVQCLRAAQEVEVGSDRAVWPDFGRYHDYRVVQLLDRVWGDAQFADGFCALFDETPEIWKNHLNERLRLIRANWFTGGSFVWDSVEDCEAR